MKTHKLFIILLTALVLPICIQAQDAGVTDVSDISKILPERERAEVMNRWLEWRLENIVPMLMRRNGIEMWLIICREYNEDPVYMSLVPEPAMAARRTSILIFHDRGEEGVERLTGSFYGMDEWYTGIWNDKSVDQFDNLARFIEERDPQTIGINESTHWAFGDGLTAGLKAELLRPLDNKYRDRLVSAEELCVGWLETRSPQELSVYRHIVGIAHDIIKEFFSNRVIVPGITRTEEVQWWIRQKITDIGLDTWFHPSVDIQRSPEDAGIYSVREGIIRRGDVLHCDIGIMYLGLATDTQQMAYVCRLGEEDAPEGLKQAFRNGNRLQDIFMNEFVTGRTGNEILRISLQKAKAEGLIPSIYTHPLGYHGHAAGPTIGLWNAQEGVPVRGDYPLYENTAYSIELNNQTPVPEWSGQLVRIALEEDASHTSAGCIFIDKRQTGYYLIK
ncbi:M24 family metallopeptidase [candidate division KSB1 bacterium]